MMILVKESSLREIEFVVLTKSHLAMATPPQERRLQSDQFGYFDKGLEEGRVGG
jgi:hypothetical protein